MSLRKSDLPNSCSPANSRKRKFKLKSNRSSANIDHVNTSWFASPTDLSPGTHLNAPGRREGEFTKSCTGEEVSTNLKSLHEFGSIGNLLEGSEELTSMSYKNRLGKSLQQLPVVSSTGSEVGPFRTETGSDCKRGEICSMPLLALHEHALLENPESEIRWYFKYFLGKYHLNYLCYDWEKNPVFLSVVPSDSSDTIYRCILWRKTGNKRLCVKHSSNGKWPSPKSILEKFSIKIDRGIKEIRSPSIQKDLLTLEEQEGSVCFKFGVLYAKAGQKTDNEMYSNEHDSECFRQFLDLLGDQVQLRGWQQFRAGLDCKNDSTGLSSVYTVYEGHEIMFHVSTLLPYTANEQQLERKRHIGNDIIVIIFVDYETDPKEAYQSAILDFDPGCMKSHFNHVFALVAYNHETGSYRLVVHSAESIPAFGPPLPVSGEFANRITFRDFLLAKLINGEKAAYSIPTFSEKRERTLGLLIKGLEENYSHEMRRAVSTPALNHSPNASKKFSEREQAFSELGQRLKVEKIITGHHPTSMRTTVAAKREPWETECIAENFPYKICCGDVCDDGALIVTTQSDGAYFIFRDGSYSLILHQSVVIGQLAVAHRHQLVLFRTAYPKETNYLYAIPLKEFYNERISVSAKPPLSCFQIPHSKGVSLFCTAPLQDQFLRLAVAVKSKVYMLAYKHPASMLLDGTPMTPSASMDPKENFIKHRVLNLFDSPVHMTLLDERPSGKLCVTYQKLTVVDAIDEFKATTQRIPNLNISKTKLTTLSSVQSNGRSELLIGYNLTCQLITLHDSTAYNSVEIVWNTEPQDLVYLHPYMLAFTEHTIEIRMATNGSLMQTINVPDLHLLSSKGDIYFTSSSNMIHTTSLKTPTSNRSFSFLSAKLPKNVERKDLISSGRYNSEAGDMTCIYKIGMENMTGRKDTDLAGFGSSISLGNSSNEDSVSRSEVISIASSEDCNSEGSTPMLDYIHPVFKDDIRTSFEVEDSPIAFSPSRKALSVTSGIFSSPDIMIHNEIAPDSDEFNEFSPSHDISRHSSSPTKLRRARKVLTSRKSLESGSRWLNPYFASSSERPGVEALLSNHMTNHMTGSSNNRGAEVLGALENVTYTSPNNSEDDFSISTNCSAISTGGSPH